QEPRRIKTRIPFYPVLNQQSRLRLGQQTVKAHMSAIALTGYALRVTVFLAVHGKKFLPGYITQSQATKRNVFAHFLVYALQKTIRREVVRRKPAQFQQRLKPIIL